MPHSKPALSALVMDKDLGKTPILPEDKHHADGPLPHFGAEDCSF